MTDRKILNNQPVQRSKHLELIFSQFNSSVSKYKFRTLIALLPLFQFVKKSEKSNAPPLCIKFYIQPPLSSFPTAPPPLQVIIAQSLSYPWNRKFNCGITANQGSKRTKFCNDHSDKIEEPDPLTVEDLISDKCIIQEDKMQGRLNGRNLCDF